MGLKKICSAILVLVFISGCFVTPRLMSSNPVSVTLSNSGPINRAQSDAIANRECQKHGKYAVLRPDNIPDGHVAYECVKP